MKTISLKLPEALYRRLEQETQRRGQSKSAVVRLALEEFLNGERPGHCLTVADVAADLLGSAEGPMDVATNPKYMEGYGR